MADGYVLHLLRNTRVQFQCMRLYSVTYNKFKRPTVSGASNSFFVGASPGLIRIIVAD